MLANRTSLNVILAAMTLAAFTPAASAMLHPGLGRFVQRDPIGYTTSASLYQYTSSNPLTRFDPSGLQDRAGPFPRNSPSTSINVTCGTAQGWGPKVWVGGLGVSFYAEFRPNGKCGCCDRIATIQVVKPTRLDGTPWTKEELPEQQKQLNENAVDGWAVDQWDDRTTPYYQDGKGPPGWPFTTYGASCGGKNEVCKLDDTPTVGEGGYNVDFETCFVCASSRDGSETGKIYACAKWGFSKQPGKDTVPYGATWATSASDEFKAAWSRWSYRHTPGDGVTGRIP